MASEDLICNMALRSIAATPIASLDENTPNGKLAKQTFAAYRDSFLTIHPWKFATKQASIAQDVDAPTWGWTYSYSLPVEPTFCLRVLHVNGEGIESGLWQPREHKILTDLSSPIEISFVYRSTAYGYWGAAAVDALAAYLAMNWAMSVTQGSAITNDAEARYERKLRRARAANGAQGTPVMIQRNDWTDARVGFSVPLVEPSD